MHHFKQMDLSSGGISWQFLWNLNFEQNPHFILKEGSETLSLCLSLGMGAFMFVKLCVFTALWMEHTWQNVYCHSCSLTAGGVPGLKYLLHPGNLSQGAWSCSRAGQGLFHKVSLCRMPRGSITAREGFFSILGGTGGELAGTKPHGILMPSLEMHTAAPSCLGCRYPAFGEKESKC